MFLCKVILTNGSAFAGDESESRAGAAGQLKMGMGGNGDAGIGGANIEIGAGAISMSGVALDRESGRTADDEEMLEESHLRCGGRS